MLYLWFVVAKSLRGSPLLWRWQSLHFARWERQQSDRVAFMIRCGVPRSVALATVLSDAVRETNLQIDVRAVHSGPKSAWMRAIANELVDMIQSSSINSNERQAAEHSVKLFSEAELMRGFRKLQNV
jgi:hypothetical protein